MSEGGVYFSAPSRTSRVLPVALILLVVAFGGFLWLWPSRSGDEGPEQPAPRAVAAEEASAAEEPSAAADLVVEEEEAPAEPAVSTASATPLVFVQSLACRAVETNSTWTAFAWHTRIGTSSPNPPTVSLTVAVLDKDGFILDSQRVYRAKVGPATAGAYQDRMLVRNAQAEQVRVCQVQIQVDEEILDTAQAQVSIDIQREVQGDTPTPSIANAPRPSGKVQVWGRPRINRIGDSAIVVVEFWNPGSTTATADFDVELSVDGEFVDSTSDSVEVGPGQRLTRQFSFDARSQGAASVNVQFR